MHRITHASARGGGRSWGARLILLLATTVLAGCGIFGPEPAPPAPTRTPLPTFTPTPELAPVTQAAAATAAPAAGPAEPAQALPSTPAPVTEAVTAPSTEANAAPTVEPPAEPIIAPTEPSAEAALTITGELVNLRRGPGTAYDLVGAVGQGERFAITGRNDAGDWWQICCLNDQSAWVFGQLAAAENAETVAVVEVAPAPVAAVAPAPAADEAVPVVDAAPAAPDTAPPAASAPDPFASSAGDFNPDAQYQIVNFHVRGLGENNGGIRDSGAQHHIFITVLDQNGNGVNGAVVKNLVGEQGEVVTGDKGPGKAEITMFWEPFKLTVASDPSGPVSSQTSNQMGLAFPHLPDLVGKLGDVNYEYGACPTIDIKCEWPITAIHFSYDITFQKVK